MKALIGLACIGSIAASSSAAAPWSPPRYESIAALVASSGSGFDNNPFDFDMLLEAAATANLVGALADPSANLTLFAPNDAAFIRLARDLGFTGTGEEAAWDFLVDALTQLGNGNPLPVLEQVLLYHVAPQRVNAIQFILLGWFNQPIVTLQGGTVQPRGFRLIDNEPDLPDAGLFVPLNAVTGNGIVHTITRVLLPIDLP